MRGCAWMCRGRSSAAPAPSRRPGQGARPFPSSMSGSTHKGRLMPRIPKRGLQGTVAHPTICPSTPHGHLLDGDGELPRGALAVADQEDSQVLALEEPLLCQVPGDPARVPPARTPGSPSDTPGHPGTPRCRIPPRGMEVPRALVQAAVGSLQGCPQGCDPPNSGFSLPFHPQFVTALWRRWGDSRVLRVLTCPHAGFVQRHPQLRPHPVTRLPTSHTSSPTLLPVPTLVPTSHVPPVGTALPGATWRGGCRAENQDETLPTCIAGSCQREVEEQSPCEFGSPRPQTPSATC